MNSVHSSLHEENIMSFLNLNCYHSQKCSVNDEIKLVVALLR